MGKHLVELDSTPVTDFGWLRAVLWSAGIAVLYGALTVLTNALAPALGATSVHAHHPGIWLAGVFGVAAELDRRNRARRAASRG